jgi:Tol biopolymer transport system component
MDELRHTLLREVSLSLLAAGALFSGLSCGGGDIQGPTTGSLHILTVTSGDEQDADGYIVTLNGGSGQVIGVNGTLTMPDLSNGTHEVQLSGVAANCRVEGANPRSVTVSAGSTAEVTFAITCNAAAGNLEITTTTTGNAPDPDGYTVAVDNGAPQTIDATASLTVPAVSPGNHQITLGGLATHCRVEADNPRSVTVTAGATTTVAFSLDCHMPRIAFTSERDGNSEIYVMRADGTGLTRLTNTLDHESQPAWSPDGARIVYVRDVVGSPMEQPGMYIMNADGSSQRRLASDPNDRSPTWSPDGAKIAFVRYSEELAPYNQIMVMNADGTGVARLDQHLWEYGSPDWSRDGSRIAFIGYYEDTPPSLGVMNNDGTGERIIADGCLSQPAWSTDGRIAVSNAPFGFDEDGAGYCLGPGQIYVMNADGSGVIQLTNNSEDDVDPAWSRDDRKIAFTRHRGQDSDIYVMNADGSGQTRLTNHPADDSDPTWSP